MDVRKIIEQRNIDLTPSEKELVKQILQNIEEAAILPAAELAARVGVHESTAIRLVQKLGFSGYRVFRRELQNEIFDVVESADRVQRRLARSHSLDDLVRDEIHALEGLTRSISQEQLNEAAELITHSRRIYLFARGHATLLVEFMDRRLRRLSYNTVDLRLEGRDLAEHIVTMGEGDLVLAFVLRHVQAGLVPLLKQAQAVKASTIVVADEVGPIIRPQADVLLWASRGTKGEALTHIVPLTICNALVLTLSEVDRNRAVDSLNRVSTLIHQFTTEDPE